MRRQLLPALRMTIALIVLLGFAYPLAMTGAAQALFRAKADGSLIARNGAVVGSGLIGQGFAAPRYFHPRPSAAGTNLGPTNPALEKAVADRAAAYRTENDLAPGTPVPVDAVTASGSGLDPAISVANARDQAPRVARARSMVVGQVLALVRAHTAGRALGVLGEPSVNVLELNLALDGSH
jgi:K+-transporting ATPase ATPase C chain